MHNPTDDHWKQLKHIIGYLRFKPELTMSYATSSQKLTAYCDADYATDPTRKSITGYLVFLGKNLIAHSSGRQKIVALSSCEAEYIALTECAKAISYFQQLLEFLNFHQSRTLIYEDNQGAIQLAESNASGKRTKHIDVRYHYIREKINSGEIELRHISTVDQLADLLTKGFGATRHHKLLNGILGNHH